MARERKVTVKLREETIRELDRLARDELLGSRGRAIEWMVRRVVRRLPDGENR